LRHSFIPESGGNISAAAIVLIIGLFPSFGATLALES
jgi:hypothetical protein